MDHMICRNQRCLYYGKPQAHAKGSMLLLLVLLLCGVVPGLIYLAFFSGYRYTCPRCGLEVGRD